MHRSLRLPQAAAAALVFAVATYGSASALSLASPTEATGSVLFVQNRGQFAAEVVAQARVGAYTLWLTRGGLVFDVAGSADNPRQWVRLDLPGARNDATPELVDPSRAAVSYLLGNDPARWHRRLPLYREAVYRDVYPHVDLKLYGRDGHIEYDFVIGPGGDPKQIRMAYDGAAAAQIDERGDVRIALGAGVLVHRQPRVHQNVDGKIVEVPATFEQTADGAVSFSVASYRGDRELVIDPAVDLVYSTYLGGSRDDQGTAIATDSQGFIYMTADTLSVDFPLGSEPGPERCNPPNYDFVVNKLTPDGQTLLYSTYIGGNASLDPWTECADAHDYSHAITVDEEGRAYVAGRTLSMDFPVVNGIADFSDGYYSQLFVLELSDDGSTILYSSVTGSSGNNDVPAGIVLDADGFIYTAGTPSVNAYYEGGSWGVNANHYPIKEAGPECEFRTDRWHSVFVVKFDPHAVGDASVVWSRCVDPGVTVGNLALVGIALDRDDNVYLGGNIGGQFPATVNAFRDGCIGNATHAFVVKLTSNGEPLYSSNFCSASSGYATFASGLAVGATGIAYLVGEVGVDDASFDLLKYPFQRYVSGWHQAPGFLAVLDTNSAGEDSLMTATALAAVPDVPQFTNKVVLDDNGNVYVAGNTNATNLLATKDAFQSAHAGGYWDCYIMQLPADGRWLYHSTYLGGTGADLCRAVAADRFGNVLVTGSTDSSDFPTVAALQGSSAGGADALLSMVRYDALARLSAAVEIPERVYPGEVIPLQVAYRNDLTFDTTDTIVRLVLPREARYLGSTAGGIYLAAAHEVFWRLGTLAAASKGTLRADIEYGWGIPGHHFAYALAEIDASNAPSHPIPDLAEYLDVQPTTVTGQQALGRDEIDALLSGNPQVAALYRQAADQGFLELGVASQRQLSNGSEEQILYMLRPESFEQIQIVVYADVVFALRFDADGGVFSAFDASGGTSTYLKENRSLGWGAWNLEPPSQAAAVAPTAASVAAAAAPTGVAVPAAGSAGAPTIAPAARAAASGCKATTNRCLLNCLADAGYSLTLGKIFEVLGPLGMGAACSMCILDSSAESCYACQTELTKKLAEKATGADIVIDVSQCLLKCAANPKSYVCDKENTGCASGWDPYRTFMGYFNVQFRTVQTCNTLTCTWDAPQYIACAFGDACVDGICKACSQVSGQGDCKKQEVITPHDPNRKSGPLGDLLAGQTVTYTIEYENVGDGTAYSVFVKDTLDANLDETTLAIQNGGLYLSPLRELYWYVGDLPAHSGGTVSFQVALRSGLASGSSVANQAVVYFPTVMEQTPTNVRVNNVYSLVAHPQVLETEAGAALDVTLDGSAAEQSELDYSVVSQPVYGSLSGTAPELTYTPLESFNGSDAFSFVVSDGAGQSTPAEVRISVLPAQDDAVAPAVVQVLPPAGTTRVIVSDQPFAAGLYPPVISATFSEPLDSATIDGTSFTLGGVQGQVSYDEAMRTAYFVPNVPLAHGVTYTATITTQVTDGNGNPISADHVWQFTTEKEVDLRVTLSPPEATGYDFGRVDLGATSDAKLITVTSTGSGDLVLGEVARDGADADRFAVTLDECSGSTLGQGLGCTVAVVFEPQTRGHQSATLSIPSNAPDANPVEVALGGFGFVAGECGNDLVETGEQCDDGDTQFRAGDYCSAQCTAVPCGIPTDPQASEPTAGDALLTLRAAVGQLLCDRRVCDVNADGAVSASDALLILRRAVGQTLDLQCPAGL